MSADKTSIVPRHKRNGLVAILAPLWGLFKLVFTLGLVCIIAVEIFTPSLNYSGSPPKMFRSAQPADWADTTDAQTRRSFRTTLTTHDYRSLQIDYFAPLNLKDSPIPLTIIVAGFMTPEWMIDKVRPQGYNAVVVYRSPRLSRMTGPMFPTSIQARNATTMTDYWNIFATNPFNHAYNIHAGMHEAPGDIVNIARWGIDNIRADPNRINVIGIGSGALIAAAATDGMQTSGISPRTLSLIYPPAMLSSAIYDNLVEWPKWSRRSASKLLDLVYFRLSLSRHLPNTGDVAKLLVLPQNAFELASYAAEPAIDLAGEKTTIERIDMNYTPYYTDKNINAVRDTVGRWLISQGAIQSY